MRGCTRAAVAAFLTHASHFAYIGLAVLVTSVNLIQTGESRTARNYSIPLCLY